MIPTPMTVSVSVAPLMTIIAMMVHVVLVQIPASRLDMVADVVKMMEPLCLKRMFAMMVHVVRTRQIVRIPEVVVIKETRLHSMFVRAADVVGVRMAASVMVVMMIPIVKEEKDVATRRMDQRNMHVIRMNHVVQMRTNVLKQVDVDQPAPLMPPFVVQMGLVVLVMMNVLQRQQVVVVRPAARVQHVVEPMAFVANQMRQQEAPDVALAAPRGAQQASTNVEVVRKRAEVVVIQGLDNRATHALVVAV